MDINAMTMTELNELVQDPNMRDTDIFKEISEQFPALAGTLKRRNVRESVKFLKMRDVINIDKDGKAYVDKKPVYLTTKRADLHVALRNMGWRIQRDGNRIVSGSLDEPELHENWNKVLNFMFESFGEYVGPVLSALHKAEREKLQAIMAEQFSTLADIGSDDDK